MNAVTFSQILTDLPDEIVERAAKPAYGKPGLRYSLPAAAAGIVLLIAAAVWPKLRTELPGVTEPPAITAVTTAAVTSEAAQTVTVSTYTAVTKAQTSAASTQAAGTQTDAAQTAAAAVTVSATALTEQNAATARQTETAAPAAVTETAPPQTVLHTTNAAEPPHTTKATVPLIVPTEQCTTPGPTIPSSVTESETNPTPENENRIRFLRTAAMMIDPETDELFESEEISCHFSEASEGNLTYYGDPDANFDRTRYTYILADVSGHFTEAVLRSCAWDTDHYSIIFSYPQETDSTPEKYSVKFLIAFPKELNITAGQLQGSASPVPRSLYDGLLAENAESVPFYPRSEY